MTDLTQSSQPIADATALAELADTAAMPADVSPDATQAVMRPDHVPEKFWDGEAGTVRTEALLKSYVELEKHLGGRGDGDAMDEDVAIDDDMPLVPATPDAYEIVSNSDLVTADPEVNRRLHEAGFTQDQAQLVYKLAEEYLLPAVSEAYGEVFVQQEVGKLEQAFGGGESWRTTAEQLRTWGKANLDADVYGTLASSYDGVLALHAMMQAREPSVVHADAPSAPADETSLRRMMQDPRYWRDRDQAFIGEVTRGFERLFKR